MSSRVNIYKNILQPLTNVTKVVKNSYENYKQYDFFSKI